MSEPLAFAGFSILVALAYWLGPAVYWRRAVLLAANALFLASLAPGWQSLLPLAGFLVLGYAGLHATRRAPQIVFVPILILTLFTFVWLKKYAFVPDGLFLRFPYITVGMSYILFRMLHLIIDASNNAVPALPGPLEYFGYTANFATLISGPIQRYPEFSKTLEAALRRRLNPTETLHGVKRMVLGVFKTNALALVFSTIQHRLLDALPRQESWELKLIYGSLIVVLYPLFLYCNFGGFIDIVLGVAQVLGLSLPENFDRPFASDNFLDFWANRWHITLSAWLRAYVYNPLLLRLMRSFPARRLEPVWAVLAFFVTFFLIGVWHGQTSEFLFYGILLGLGVSVNKTYQLAMIARMGRKRFSALSAKSVYVAVARGLTFTYFAVTLLWFWSTWPQIAAFRRMLGIGLSAAVLLAIIAGSTIALAIWEGVRNRIRNSHAFQDRSLAPLRELAWYTAMGVVVVVLTVIMNQTAPEIVYKAF